MKTFRPHEDEYYAFLSHPRYALKHLLLSRNDISSTSKLKLRTYLPYITVSSNV